MDTIYQMIDLIRYNQEYYNKEGKRVSNDPIPCVECMRRVTRLECNQLRPISLELRHDAHRSRIYFQDIAESSHGYVGCVRCSR